MLKLTDSEHISFLSAVKKEKENNVNATSIWLSEAFNKHLTEYELANLCRADELPNGFLTVKGLYKRVDSEQVGDWRIGE